MSYECVEQAQLVASNALENGDMMNTLGAACRETEAISFDRCSFHLGEEEFERFTAMLDNPPKSNPKLVKLLARKPVWYECVKQAQPKERADKQLKCAG